MPRAGGQARRSQSVCPGGDQQRGIAGGQETPGPSPAGQRSPLSADQTEPADQTEQVFELTIIFRCVRCGMQLSGSQVGVNHTRPRAQQHVAATCRKWQNERVQHIHGVSLPSAGFILKDGGPNGRESGAAEVLCSHGLHSDGWTDCINPLGCEGPIRHREWHGWRCSKATQPRYSQSFFASEPAKIAEQR